MKKSPHPDWALTHRKPGTELRNINGRYYLYEVSSKWDPDKKRAKKITGKILGRISKDNGFVESDKSRLRKSKYKPLDIGPVQVKEFGASFFIQQQFGEDMELVKTVFPEIWQEVISLTFLRLLYNAPIKNLPHYFQSSYFSELYPQINMAEKRISALYRKIGTERGAVVEYMKSYIGDEDYILFDGTDFVSYSNNIESAKIGYNSKRTYDPQLNILFLFSSSLKAPVFYRVLPGNIRDVRAFKLTLEEADISKAVVIADKGFYSQDNIETLDSLSLKYIIPLRRSNAAINYGPYGATTNEWFDGYFEYQKRFVWYKHSKVKGKDIYLYFDSSLKTKEENDYLRRIATHPEKYSIEKFHDKSNAFGTLAFVSNIENSSPEEIYNTYKTRGQIETMIDAMKNILDMDNSYMQNETALQGWMFIAFMALRWYYKIHVMLIGDKKLKKTTPKDLLMHLSEVKKLKINDKWVVSEYTKKTQKLLEKLNLHIT